MFQIVWSFSYRGNCAAAQPELGEVSLVSHRDTTPMGTHLHQP